MKCKTNRPISIRIGTTQECIFKSLVPGEVYDFPVKLIRSKGLIMIGKVTTGKIGKKKVETKQFDSYKIKLEDIKGIGKKTVKDIIKVYPSEEDLKKAISENDELPFRDDVEKLLRGVKWESD